MNKREIDSILNEFQGTEMMKKARIINKDNKDFTLVISTGQITSSFKKIVEFRKFIKEIARK